MGRPGPTRFHDIREIVLGARGRYPLFSEQLIVLLGVLLRSVQRLTRDMRDEDAFTVMAVAAAISSDAVRVMVKQETLVVREDDGQSPVFLGINGDGLKRIIIRNVGHV